MRFTEAHLGLTLAELKLSGHAQLLAMSGKGYVKKDPAVEEQEQRETPAAAASIIAQKK